MSLMLIVKYGDPVLRRKAALVERIDESLKALIQDMLSTMYAAPGIGLSANQVGVSKALAVIDLQLEGRLNPIVSINPVVEHRSGSLFDEEGCLSIPGFAAKIKRASRVCIRALNADGLPVQLEADGLMARCLQHEIDHLNGRFYIDHLPLVQRLKMRRRIAIRKRDGLF